MSAGQQPETTLFWHAECTSGMSIDFKTTGDHRPDLPDAVPINCPGCHGEHLAVQVTEAEHEAYKADCEGSATCPAYYHDHGCFADVDGSQCREPEAHVEVPTPDAAAVPAPEDLIEKPADDQAQDPSTEIAGDLASPVYDQLRTIIMACFTAAGPDGIETFRRVVDQVLADAGVPDANAELDAELEACRQELAVQVARAGAAEAALINRSDAAELQGRLRRIAEAQVRELDAEVRRLRALVPLEQRHPRTTDENGARD